MMGLLKTSLRCRWQTRATQCLRPTVLYTDVVGYSVINWWSRPSPIVLKAPLNSDQPTVSSLPLSGAPFRGQFRW